MSEFKSKKKKKNINIFKIECYLLLSINLIFMHNLKLQKYKI